MFDFNTLAEFSRTNCGGICAFLIPSIISATLLTIILTVVGRPTSQVFLSAGFASLLSGIMVFHVYTWLIIGVVMLPTYILLSLAVSCLVINLGLVLLKISDWQLVDLRIRERAIDK
ncbi:hypothetical protein VB711_21050 [Cronbergia sp. UHCC 0137]|uniref:hypothetical protein n=1 Tax=Cronbergia sp. UHCC 0137 TaxID=3110239 RepID=UPI002B2143F5|nr:hypothetical protein [Cronbergia sp. UHCC 0137]MEA5620313.1 hypothetical protein [Cronbergia sp. UHCC 0137]